MAVLKEVKVMWASVQEPNEMSGKYQVDAVELTDAQVKEFENAGCNVQTCDRDGDDNRGRFVTLKSTRPIKVVDMDKKELDCLVGNGSICNIAWNPFSWTFQKKSGISAGLGALQVVDLVAYSAGGVDEFEGEDPSDDEIPF